MAKHLFLTSEFMPDVDASGICVYNLSKELTKKLTRYYYLRR